MKRSYDDKLVSVLAKSLDKHIPNLKEAILLEVTTELGINPLQENIPLHDMDETWGVEEIVWFVKGMKPAGPDDSFAFTFIRSKEGRIYKNTERLYKKLREVRRLRIGAYEYELGGNNDSRISRTIVGDRI